MNTNRVNAHKVVSVVLKCGTRTTNGTPSIIGTGP